MPSSARSVLTAATLILAAVATPHEAVASNLLSALTNPVDANLALFGIASSGSTVELNLTSVAITGAVGIFTGDTIANASGSSISGNVYESASGQYTGTGTLGGATLIAATSLQQLETAAVSDASAAAAMTATQTFAQITTTTTITGNGGVNVINIAGINLGAGKTITLSGGANDYFIVNVSKAINVSGTGSGLLLTGGVTASHVLYNLTGTGADNLITTHASESFYGTFLQANAISAAGDSLAGSFFGELVGNGKITFASSATLSANGFSGLATPEPSTFLLSVCGAALFLGLRGFGSQKPPSA